MGLSFFRKIQKRDRGFSVEIDGVPYPVQVIENDRAKRITLRLSPAGDGLKVTVPGHVGDMEIESFVDRNLNWAAARMSRLPQKTVISEGAVIPFRGIDYHIASSGKLRGIVRPVIAEDGKTVLKVPGDAASMGRKLLSYLKQQARDDLNAAVSKHAVQIGVRPRKIRITDTTSRWGSCSTTRTLSFSWRIVMAPPEVLNYLAAHEVAHLVEMNHSERFWKLTRELCPDTDRQKSWLRIHGSKLHAITFQVQPARQTIMPE